MENTDQELVNALAGATKEIMDKTGLPFNVAVKRAKEGLKQYIKLRVDTMKQLVDEGYSEERAFSEAKRLVGLGLSLRSD